MIDVRAEIVDAKAQRQTFEQQTKEIMAQLHASQLECQILKNQGEIEGADTIRKRLVCFCICLVSAKNVYLGRTTNKTTQRIQAKYYFRNKSARARKRK